VHHVHAVYSVSDLSVRTQVCSPNATVVAIVAAAAAAAVVVLTLATTKQRLTVNILSIVLTHCDNAHCYHNHYYSSNKFALKHN
jgi:uncharacterized protein YvpB